MSLYHSSAKRIRSGTMLKARSSGFVASEHAAETEKILEAARPEQMLSRRRSVFAIASTDPFEILRSGAEIGVLHEVEALGPVETNHSGWWNLIDTARRSIGPRQLQQWAEYYWRGEECPDALCLEHGALPGGREHRSTGARVMRPTIARANYADGSSAEMHGECIYLTSAPDAVDLRRVLDGLGVPSMVGAQTVVHMANVKTRAWAMIEIERMLRIPEAALEQAPGLSR